MVGDAMPYGRLAFLDTMVLHYLQLYMAEVPEHVMYPTGCVVGSGEPTYGSEGDRDAAIAKTREHIIGRASDGDREFWNSVDKGLSVVSFLMGSDGTRPYVVEYAMVSELELMSGKVRGAAVMKYAREGVPQRMWGRLRDEGIARRVGLVDRRRIWSEVEGMRNGLDDLGLGVADRSGSGVGDAMELAKGLVQAVHLSTVDAIVYASALVARADCLITNDEYLHEVVESVSLAELNGTDEECRQAALEIRRMVGADGKGHEVFPRGRRFGKGGLEIESRARRRVRKAATRSSEK